MLTLLVQGLHFGNDVPKTDLVNPVGVATETTRNTG